MALLQKVVSILAETGTLPSKFKPHKLSGNYDNCWECHIKGDWLLIWLQNDNELTLLFINTGHTATYFSCFFLVVHYRLSVLSYGFSVKLEG